MEDNFKIFNLNLEMTPNLIPPKIADQFRKEIITLNPNLKNNPEFLKDIEIKNAFWVTFNILSLIKNYNTISKKGSIQRKYINSQTDELFKQIPNKNEDWRLLSWHIQKLNLLNERFHKICDSSKMEQKNLDLFLYLNFQTIIQLLENFVNEKVYLRFNDNKSIVICMHSIFEAIEKLFESDKNKSDKWQSLKYQSANLRKKIIHFYIHDNPKKPDVQTRSGSYVLTEKDHSSRPKLQQAIEVLKENKLFSSLDFQDYFESVLTWFDKKESNIILKYSPINILHYLRFCYYKIEELLN